MQCITDGLREGGGFFPFFGARGCSGRVWLRNCGRAVLSLERLLLELWNFGQDLIKSLLRICTFAVLVSCLEYSRSFGFCSVDASPASSDFSWSTVEYS